MSPISGDDNRLSRARQIYQGLMQDIPEAQKESQEGWYPAERLLNLPGVEGDPNAAYTALSLMAAANPNMIIDFSKLMSNTDMLANLYRATGATGDPYSEQLLTQLQGMPQYAPAAFFEYGKPWRGRNFLETLSNLGATQESLGTQRGIPAFGEMPSYLAFAPERLGEVLSAYEEAYKPAREATPSTFEDTLYQPVLSALGAFTGTPPEKRRDIKEWQGLVEQLLQAGIPPSE